jgi:hypothetical protein
MNREHATRLATELETVSNCAVDINPEMPTSDFIVSGDFYLDDVFQAIYRIGHIDGIESKKGEVDNEFPPLAIEKTNEGLSIR